MNRVLVFSEKKTECLLQILLGALKVKNIFMYALTKTSAVEYAQRNTRQFSQRTTKSTKWRVRPAKSRSAWPSLIRVDAVRSMGS